MFSAFAMAPKKRQRLSPNELDAELAALVDLRAGIPFVSQSALAAILKLAEANELPKVGTRRMVRAARDKFVAKQTPYGTIHQVITDKSGRQFEVQHPFAVLWELCRTSPAIAELVKSLPRSPHPLH